MITHDRATLLCQTLLGIAIGYWLHNTQQKQPHACPPAHKLWTWLEQANCAAALFFFFVRGIARLRLEATPAVVTSLFIIFPVFFLYFFS